MFGYWFHWFSLLRAEGLVSGAASLAKRIGISPLVIGLTIVSIGTSMPELIVSVKAAMNGQSAISIGNVLGSNFFNIGIILGMSALIYPLAVKRQLLKLDVPVMIFAALLFFLMFLDYKISHMEALIFILLLLSYISYLLFISKKNTAVEEEEEEIKQTKHWALDILFIGVGLLALVYGSDLLGEHADCRTAGNVGSHDRTHNCGCWYEYARIGNFCGGSNEKAVRYCHWQRGRLQHI